MVIVTTLGQNPNEFFFSNSTVTGRGDNPRYTLQLPGIVEESKPNIFRVYAMSLDGTYLKLFLGLSGYPASSFQSYFLPFIQSPWFDFHLFGVCAGLHNPIVVLGE